jgi:hypothetical protein
VLLLVAFVYRIVTLPPHLAVPAPPPVPPPELEPPAASPELEPSARPLWLAPARPGEAGYEQPMRVFVKRRVSGAGRRWLARWRHAAGL